MERVEYNKAIKIMEELVADTMDMSEVILRDTDKHQQENVNLKKMLKIERERFESTLATQKREEAIKLHDLYSQLK